MTNVRHGSVGLAAGGLALALVLTACSSDGEGGTTAPASSNADCAAYSEYGDLSGKTVTLYAGIVAPEDQAYIDSYKPFEDCTGATIQYQADKSFEQQVLVQAQAGNAPDLAIVPQPGLLQQLVGTGKAVAAPSAVSTNVDTFWGEDWK